jgi:hypothetical protein
MKGFLTYPKILILEEDYMKTDAKAAWKKR